MKTMVMGDVHGKFGGLNTFISKHNPDIILQAGDFGYWPKEFNKTYLDNTGRIRTWNSKIKNPRTEIYWCDGNHEDFDALNNRITDELWPNVFYQKRGSVRMLQDGRNVLFMGGAFSIDGKYRTPGYDWFPEDEKINQRDIMNLPDVDIDIVISHTAPNEFIINDDRIMEREIKDASRDALSVVLDKYRPKFWWFGHFHHYQKGLFRDCKWTALGDLGGSYRYFEMI